MTDFKYGQLLVSKEDTVIEKALSGDKVVVPKGNKVVIGWDGLAHHLRDGCIQPLGEGTTITGAVNNGVVEIICRYLAARLPLKEALEEYDVTLAEVKEIIEEALEEIGLYAEEEIE